MCVCVIITVIFLPIVRKILGVTQRTTQSESMSARQRGKRVLSEENAHQGRIRKSGSSGPFKSLKFQEATRPYVNKGFMGLWGLKHLHKVSKGRGERKILIPCHKQNVQCLTKKTRILCFLLLGHHLLS